MLFEGMMRVVKDPKRSHARNDDTGDVRGDNDIAIALLYKTFKGHACEKRAVRAILVWKTSRRSEMETRGRRVTVARSKVIKSL